jgi:SPP1 gp7 family putative phage head morphogenesis protein
MSKKLDQLFTDKNQRLFDLLFRHQVYLEGVKAGLANDFAAMLTELFQKFAKYIGQMRYTTMDEFTKLELNEFIRKFNNVQSEAYNSYTESLIQLLQAFLDSDVEVSQAMDEDIEGVKSPDQNNDRLWASVNSQPIPANGELIKPYIKRFSTAAQFAVIALIRMGYANGWTAAQLTEALAGARETLFRNGLFAKLTAQNRSLVNTVMQQVSSGVQASVFSGTYDRYQWVAILDNRTTVICRSRNGTIYEYGKGPLPPAHYNCRSKAVPLLNGTESHEIPESYWEWLSQQPESFQNDVLGLDTATKLRNGELKSSDFKSISTNEPLTISDFTSKIKFILAL